MNDKKNNRAIGTDYEKIAADYLSSNGMKIYTTNFRSRGGEIDLIGFMDNQLIFIEVKYRKDDKKGSPEEAVDLRKQKKICQVAAYFLYCHPQFIERVIRYDVVAICGDQIHWHKNAFPHYGQ